MANQDSIERAVGKIEGAVTALTSTVTTALAEWREERKEIHAEIGGLHIEFTELHNDFSALQKEHDKRVEAGTQCSPVIVNQQPVSIDKLGLKDIIKVKDLGYIFLGALLAFGVVAVGAAVVALKLAQVF